MLVFWHDSKSRQKTSIYLTKMGNSWWIFKWAPHMSGGIMKAQKKSYWGLQMHAVVSWTNNMRFLNPKTWVCTAVHCGSSQQVWNYFSPKIFLYRNFYRLDSTSTSSCISQPEGDRGFLGKFFLFIKILFRPRNKTFH